MMIGMGIQKIELTPRDWNERGAALAAQLTKRVGGKR